MSVADELGVMYIAVGDRYREEAAYSARQLKSAADNISVTAVVDENPDFPVFDDTIIVEPLDGFLNKVEYMRNLPYEKTLFLDTDTYVFGDISEVFDLLGDFDVAVCQKQDYYARSIYSEELPDSFPEFNTGVIGFHRSKESLEFIDAWSEEYRAHASEHYHDQISFRNALYQSGLDFAPLGPEYNVRLQPGHVSREAKILHARIDGKPFGSDAYREEIQAIAQALNEHTDRSRAFTYDGEFEILKARDKHPEYRHTSLITRVICSIREHGLIDTIARGSERVLNGKH